MVFKLLFLVYLGVFALLFLVKFVFSPLESVFLDPVIKGDIETVKVLLDKHPKWLKLDDLGLYGLKPLHYAANTNNIEMTKLLIEKGFNINQYCLWAGTPLHRAVLFGNIDIIELLIVKGADVNAAYQGGTPLNVAVTSVLCKEKGNRKQIIDLLIDKGADVNIRNDDLSGTPLPTSFFSGEDIIIRDDNLPCTPLQSAVIGGEIELLKTLMDKGADVNVRNSDKLKYTPLHYAVIDGKIEIMETLLANGADVNAEGLDGKTPLAVAIDKGDKKIADLLTRHGAIG